jgi:Flp pilus assembly protein TadD
MVRDASGEPLRTPALVRLFSADGMPLGQVSVVGGGDATFRGVHRGSYGVEVEASGYVKGHGSATLPMTGEVHVEIYLRREPIVVPDTGVPVLAPRARKEMDEGLEALRKKDYGEAQRHLEKAQQMSPMHPDVLYLLGSLSARMNDLPRAEELLGKATQMEPQHAHAQAALGVVLTNERKFDTAMQPLGKALELDEKSWEARWALARCYYQQRKFQPALEQSRRALQDSNGQAPEIALVAAASLSALGQYEDSAAMLREFLQRHPDHVGAARARRWLDRLQVAGKIKQN